MEISYNKRRRSAHDGPRRDPMQASPALQLAILAFPFCLTRTSRVC